MIQKYYSRTEQYQKIKLHFEKQMFWHNVVQPAYKSVVLWSQSGNTDVVEVLVKWRDQKLEIAGFYAMNLIANTYEY